MTKGRRGKVRIKNGLLELTFELDEKVLEIIRTYLADTKEFDISGVLDLKNGKLTIILVPELLHAAA